MEILRYAGIMLRSGRQSSTKRAMVPGRAEGRGAPRETNPDVNNQVVIHKAAFDSHPAPNRK